MRFAIPWSKIHDGVHEQQDRESRVNRLARFNSEAGRGILHTPEWTAFMAEEQEWFNSGCPREDSYPLRPGMRLTRVSNTGKSPQDG